MGTPKEVTVKRDYKSTLFAKLFSDKKNLLELYNAVNGTDYDDPELFTINTLEHAIYMAMKNDVSFIVDLRLSLYEHQSTFNPNMPLRFLIYLADLYEGLVKDENIYGTKMIMLPTPKFVVFYNGQEEQPDYRKLCLSESYLVKEEEVNMELKVDMYNINIGHNEELLKTCKVLGDYSEYVFRVRSYANRGMPIEMAVDKAIEECMQEGILEEVLRKERAEVRKMSIYEYDYEKHMKMEREQHFAEGLAQGREEGLSQGRNEGKYEEACENARRLFENGASYDLVKNSITDLSDQELQKIYEVTRR